MQNCKNLKSGERLIKKNMKNMKNMKTLLELG